MTELYEKLNQAWKQTCKIVLGDEVGELSEYKPWLEEVFKEYSSPEYGPWKKEVSSALTEKAVYVFAPFYEKGAKFAEYDLLKEKKIEPLSLDEIKDIDSILEAWKERWCYKASVVLGKSYHVEESDSVFNSSFVLGSYAVAESSYVAYSIWVRNGGRYIFGSGGGPGFKFAIRSGYGAGFNRGMGTYFFANVSDVYFSHYIFDSSEVMFSFNQIGKHYIIGNLQLTKDKYMQTKAALLEQIRAELKAKKRFPSLMELVAENKAKLLPIPEEELKKISVEEEKCDMKPIEAGFERTTKLLLGESFTLDELKGYLMGKRAVPPQLIETPSGAKAVYYSVLYHTSWPSDINLRIIIDKEANAAATVTLEESSIKELRSIRQSIGRIAYISQSLSYKSMNICSVPISFNSRDVAYIFDTTENKVAAYNYVGSPSSSYIFGSFFTTNSSFVINSDVNENLQRAIEADRCSNSSDIYFSHDIDGSTEVMFSQHLKGARYTIGNLALDKEKYLSIKASLLSQVVNELKSKGKLHFGVRELGV